MSYTKQIAKHISKVVPHINAKQIEALIEIPPDTTHGDFALACFKLAKEFKKNPSVIAGEIGALINASPLPAFIARAEVANAYVNFTICKVALVKDFFKAYQKNLQAAQNIASGKSKSPNASKTILIDYSSVNIAKEFHIGNHSSTAIGAALYRIYKYLGYNVVGINHLGDYGSQFGKLIAAYLDSDIMSEAGFGAGAGVGGASSATSYNGGADTGGANTTEPQLDLKALTKIYQIFTAKAKDNVSLNESGKNWFLKLERGDKTAKRVFTKFKDITLRETKVIYEMLGVDFDSWAGESYYSDKMDIVFDLLASKKLLSVKEDGAQYIDLEKLASLPRLVLRRSDGATLYATRDLAAAIYRKNKYNFHKCLYVVAYQQDLHFKQVFATLKLAGLKWYKDLEHISFGMVSVGGQALSTRGGNVVFLRDAIQKAVEKATAIIEERNPTLKNKESVAKAIGVGALNFAPLFNNRIKDVDFNYDKALSFEGDTSVYIQYTYARANTVLSKSRESGGICVSNLLENSDPTSAEPTKADPTKTALPKTPLPKIEYDLLSDEHSVELIKSLSAYEQAIIDAANKNEPSTLTRQILDIAKKYNTFYANNRILNIECSQTMLSRLTLTAITMKHIKNGLGLLGIETVDKM
ncbi:MAG: arginine--tRNA ligase [Firmicutes bacterium]|nr:arginine--tRNA ligase [Bacillota bacterium]